MSDEDSTLEMGEIDEAPPAKKIKIEDAGTEPSTEEEQVIPPKTADDEQEAKIDFSKLIEKKAWDEIITWIKGETGRGHEVPELEVPNEIGYYPLNYAVGAGAPLNVIKTMVEANADLLNMKSWRLTPFDEAIQCEPLDEEIIQFLLDHYPIGVTELVEGSSVFHRVLQRKPTLKLLTMLVEAWAKCKDCSVDDAWKKLAKERDHYDCLLLHVAIDSQASTDVILKIIDSNQDAVITSSCQGESQTPLHCAAQSLCTKPVLDKLLELGTGQIMAKTKTEKLTPLHCLFNPNTSKDWTSNMPEVWTRGNYGDLVKPDVFARRLIVAHGKAIRNATGKSKTQESAGKRAKSLLNTKNKYGTTVLKQAEALEEKIQEQATPRGYSAAM